MFHTEALHLEELLAGHGMAVRVGRASLSTDAMRFPLQLGLGVTTRRLMDLAGDVAREAGYSHCRLRREGPTLFLELPRDEGAGLRYGDLLGLNVARQGELLGITERGTLVTLHLGEATMSHLLVVGSAGVGKSELLRVLALGIAAQHAPRHWRLALLESQPDGPLRSMRELPHCWAASDRSEGAIGWLVRLVTEMIAREEAGVRGPRVLAAVDDADTLLREGGSVVRSVLKALLGRGPAVGIHLAVAARSTAGWEGLLPGFPLHLRAEAEVAPGHFTLHHAGDALPMLAARLDGREVRAVAEGLAARRVRLVARPVAAEGVAP